MPTYFFPAESVANNPAKKRATPAQGSLSCYIYRKKPCGGGKCDRAVSFSYAVKKLKVKFYPILYAFIMGVGSGCTIFKLHNSNYLEVYYDNHTVYMSSIASKNKFAHQACMVVDKDWLYFLHDFGDGPLPYWQLSSNWLDSVSPYRQYSIDKTFFASTAGFKYVKVKNEIRVLYAMDSLVIDTLQFALSKSDTVRGIFRFDRLLQSSTSQTLGGYSIYQKDTFINVLHRNIPVHWFKEFFLENPDTNGGIDRRTKLCSYSIRDIFLDTTRLIPCQYSIQYFDKECKLLEDSQSVYQVSDITKLRKSPFFIMGKWDYCINCKD